jgi:DNA mismatch repair protein MutS
MPKADSVKPTKETPLMKQYSAIKARYAGALLLFRVGDFYETFGEDAVTASKILNITLTKRANGSASEVALAGFPHHALDNYLPKLVRAGQRVAICDQLEDPKDAIGIVKRGVTELVTPGVSMSDHVLDTRKNNWLAAVFKSEDRVGLALIDISTGEFLVFEGSESEVDKVFQSYQPTEVLHARSAKGWIENWLGDKIYNTPVDDWQFQFDTAFDLLNRHFETTNLKGFGVEDWPAAVVSAGVILYYLLETEHRQLGHVSSLSRIDEGDFAWLDRFTIRNLELVYAQQEGGIPLVEILDKTVCPMGSRMLRKWILMPLKSLPAILDRQNMVEAMLQNEFQALEIQALLKQVGDLERVVSKAAVKRISPREIGFLKKALQLIVQVKAGLKPVLNSGWQLLGDQLNPCEALLQKIESELIDDLPALSNQGGMIKSGVDPELDRLHDIAYRGKDYLVKINQNEIERTGISSLKIAYNRVFGYYLEVTNAHKDKVPSDWIRKQTLTGAERYITQELKEYEEQILGAEEKIVAIEQAIFNRLVDAIEQYTTPLLLNARLLGQADCLISFATVAREFGYCKPELNTEKAILIRDGRHPVIERQMAAGEKYVPNDIDLNPENQQIVIITGPNMAGKSALLRQTALIVLMAQMGSYVPATSAEIGLVDKVFTRVGASDNLSRGESTFMVEMTETASILNNLTDRSLVLMDEIGRGTSTYDGISIAWAIVEYLHNHPNRKAKTLFATHYHELNELAENMGGIKNFNVAVKESGNKVLFIRKLKPGGSEHSFGIHVAQMAGMPTPVVLRAMEIMKELEKTRQQDNRKDALKKMPKAQSIQYSLFQPVDESVEKLKSILNGLDINTISPVEALLKLQELKLMIK